MCLSLQGNLYIFIVGHSEGTVLRLLPHLLENLELRRKGTVLRLLPHLLENPEFIYIF